MADVTAKSGQKKDVAKETARKEAQLEWALEELRREDAPVYELQKDGSLAVIKGNTDARVIVVPDFVYDGKKKKWLPADTFVRQGNNKAFGSLLLMALPGEATGRERWQDKAWSLGTNRGGNFTITALAPMTIEDTERFEAGMLLKGRIDTAYTLIPTNPGNLDQDKWYINADARDLDIACTDAEGNTYYQKRYFEDDLSYPAPIQPKIDRKKLLEEIAAAKA